MYLVNSLQSSRPICRSGSNCFAKSKFLRPAVCACTGLTSFVALRSTLRIHHGVRVFAEALSIARTTHNLKNRSISGSESNDETLKYLKSLASQLQDKIAALENAAASKADQATGAVTDALQSAKQSLGMTPAERTASSACLKRVKQTH